ncbi:MAG: copper(I)-binding protein [Psychromonas sp.]|jgi:copper(I)-binding protein|uniref:copper chaperone PCu(A)C n=1 Tax=Psychromonas sp. TaxID=1884585 RepID=UPI0039E6B87B
MKTFISLLVAVGLLLLSAQSFANPLTVEDLYVRATPPNSKNSAAFMVIKNTAKKDIKLIAAGSDIASRVELHNHVMDNGLMKMRQVKEIIIKAESSVALQPGGYHVMFLNLKQPLKEGQSVTLSLSFDNGQQLTVDAPVKKIKIHK